MKQSLYNIYVILYIGNINHFLHSQKLIDNGINTTAQETIHWDGYNPNGQYLHQYHHTWLGPKPFTFTTALLHTTATLTITITITSITTTITTSATILLHFLLRLFFLFFFTLHFLMIIVHTNPVDCAHNHRTRRHRQSQHITHQHRQRRHKLRNKRRTIRQACNRLSNRLQHRLAKQHKSEANGETRQASNINRCVLTASNLTGARILINLRKWAQHIGDVITAMRKGNRTRRGHQIQSEIVLIVEFGLRPYIQISIIIHICSCFGGITIIRAI
mmetsp:Transcript_35495/g.58143  ORF Transcript_35495/g.58143 Transcript_35495/m.58143 type:complete len:275 (-) Transcript_35495:242-1066(-)